MHLHINHCFCSDSCWDNKIYWSRYMVCIERKHAEDWNNLLQKSTNTPYLKQEVIDWLSENIKDTTDKDQLKGWCMGSDVYRNRDKFSFVLWFYRRSDAMKFIKRWSTYSKPTTYFDYFKGIHKELINGKLITK